MTETLKKQITEFVSEYVSRHITTYEQYDSSIREVTRYYLTSAKLLLDQGWNEEEILSTIKESIGNYLLGKKYGVTSSVYVQNLIFISTQINDTYEKQR